MIRSLARSVPSAASSPAQATSSLSPFVRESVLAFARRQLSQADEVTELLDLEGNDLVSSADPALLAKYQVGSLEPASPRNPGAPIERKVYAIELAPLIYRVFVVETGPEGRRFLDEGKLRLGRVIDEAMFIDPV
jgi:hypothetical protein